MADKESLATFKLARDLVKARGIASQTSDRVEMLVHEAELFSIAFTPAKDERPNGLDVWRHGDRNTKVLDVIWSDGTMPLILAYRCGAWEKLLRQQGPEDQRFAAQKLS
jgi:hypothetical protein